MLSLRTALRSRPLSGRRTLFSERVARPLNGLRGELTPAESRPDVLQQKREPTPVENRPEFVLACPELHSIVNLSRIVRACGCIGLNRMLVSGTGKVDAKVSRGAEAQLEIRTCQTLHHRLKKLKASGFKVVGLEQTTGSINLASFLFPRQCVLLLGTEKKGISQSDLELCDATVEIPMFGFPQSHNVAAAATLAMWEYVKQHPPTELQERPASAEAQKAAISATMLDMYSRRSLRRRRMARR